MTPPVRAAYVTDELVEQFARYYLQNRAWGVFHVWLDDGNYKLAVTDYDRMGSVTTEEHGLLDVFAKLTPSQRYRLGKNAERRARSAERALKGRP